MDNVPASPPQTLELRPDGRFIAEGQELEQYQDEQYYQIESLPNGTTQLGLYKNPTDARFYLQMVLKNDTLRLSPPCFEGCHFSFVRLR